MHKSQKQVQQDTYTTMISQKANFDADLKPSSDTGTGLIKHCHDIRKLDHEMFCNSRHIKINKKEIIQDGFNRSTSLSNSIIIDEKRFDKTNNGLKKNSQKEVFNVGVNLFKVTQTRTTLPTYEDFYKQNKHSGTYSIAKIESLASVSNTDTHIFADKNSTKMLSTKNIKQDIKLQAFDKNYSSSTLIEKKYYSNFIQTDLNISKLLNSCTGSVQQQNDKKDQCTHISSVRENDEILNSIDSSWRDHKLNTDRELLRIIEESEFNHLRLDSIEEEPESNFESDFVNIPQFANRKKKNSGDKTNIRFKSPISDKMYNVNECVSDEDSLSDLECNYSTDLSERFLDREIKVPNISVRIFDAKVGVMERLNAKNLKKA